jgi:hypothetical protein
MDRPYLGLRAHPAVCLGIEGEYRFYFFMRRLQRVRFYPTRFAEFTERLAATGVDVRKRDATDDEGGLRVGPDVVVYVGSPWGAPLSVTWEDTRVAAENAAFIDCYA